MKRQIYLSTFTLLTVLALTGAGCSTANTSPSESASYSKPAAITKTPTTTKTPVVPKEKIATFTPPTSCTKTGTVTVNMTNEQNTTFDVLLNGEIVKSYTFEGEHYLEQMETITGMTFLASRPSGLGGYIPYGAMGAYIGVDHCTGAITEVNPSNEPQHNGMSLQDLSDNGSLAAFAYAVNGTTATVGIINVGTATSPYTSPSTWTIPGTWEFVGTTTFNKDATKLAVAVATGPDVETSAVYTLDLTTGVFTKVAENPTGHLYVNSWNDDGTINSSTTAQE